MFRIKIKCLFETEAQREQNDILDTETDLVEMEEKPVTFFSIAALAPYNEKGVIYTSIVSGSTTFITKLKISEIEKIIDEYYAVKN